jgi:hypothetical protein
LVHSELRFIRLSTTLAPLTALLAAAVLAMVLAAQAGLAFCNNRVAVAMPANMMASMPGIDMTGGMQADMGGHVLMICPVVLVLIVTSALLAAAAIVLLWRDPHRGLTRRTILHVLAHLPPIRTAATLVIFGGAAVLTMRALDGSGPPALPACVLLTALLVGCSLTATLFSIIAGRVAIALGFRLILAVVAALARVPDVAAPCAQRLAPLSVNLNFICLLASGQGLRAPPSPAR